MTSTSLTKNSRVEDLFLLAKGRYTIPSGMHGAEAVRRLVAFHNLHDSSRMSWHCAAYVCLSDLQDAGCLRETVGNENALRALLVDDLAPNRFGNSEVARTMGPNHEQPGGYHAVLIDALMSRAAMCRVRDDAGNWLLDVKERDTDPVVQAFLNADT